MEETTLARLGPDWPLREGESMLHESEMMREVREGGEKGDQTGTGQTAGEGSE